MNDTARKIVSLTPAAHRSTDITIGSLPDATIRRLRAARRLAANIPAQLKSERWVQPVEVRNISLTGAGLRGAFDARPGETLTILLQDGRALQAEVRWSRAGFCGLQFTSPLRVDDPVFDGRMLACTRTMPGGNSAQIIPVHGSASDQQLPAAPMLSVAPLPSTRQLDQRSMSIINSVFLTALKAMSQRRLERSCRKQGFAWLVDETAENEPE